jgi:hypothetical protein
MCSANHNGLYYDIWALRHQIWNPVDPFIQSLFFQNNYSRIKSLLISVCWKMIKIPKVSNWI